MLEAGDVISAEEAERRVLVLENPGMPGKSRVTNSLFAGIQLILLNLAEPLPVRLRSTPLVYNSLSTVELAEILRHCQAFIGTKNDDFAIAYFLKVPALIAVVRGERGLPAADDNVGIHFCPRRLEFPLQRAKALLIETLARTRPRPVH